MKVTDELSIEEIKENKLKSAILTTRGGAYRDLGKYNEAENCAKKAIKYQPDSHHPYTLMGAICYDTRRYYEGDDWFNQAIKRGASLRDIDAELKRVVQKAKGKERQDFINYLLNKDEQRYAWVRKYLPKFRQKIQIKCNYKPKTATTLQRNISN